MPLRIPKDSPATHLPTLWQRARRWCRQLLRRDPAPLVESDPGLSTPSAAVSPPGRAQVARLTADELALVRKDLRKVLDRHPESRRVMRYLRALEHGLHKKGRLALEQLPVDLLRRALGQLDLLVADRSLQGLATLRSKAAISIADRESLASGRDRHRGQVRDDDVHVEDVSHSAFMEVHNEWERSFSNSVPPAESKSADKAGRT